jgi:hypothetical protein
MFDLNANLQISAATNASNKNLYVTQKDRNEAERAWNRRVFEDWKKYGKLGLGFGTCLHIFSTPCRIGGLL